MSDRQVGTPPTRPIVVPCRQDRCSRDALASSEAPLLGWHGHGGRADRGPGGLPGMRQATRGLDGGARSRIRPRGRRLLFGALRPQSPRAGCLRGVRKARGNLQAGGVRPGESGRTEPGESASARRGWSLPASSKCGTRRQTLQALGLAVVCGSRGCGEERRCVADARATVRRKPNIGTPRARFRGAFSSPGVGCRQQSRKSSSPLGGEAG